MISELMEAVEADRKGRKTKFDDVEYLWCTRLMEYDNFYTDFEKHIKDTVEDELADAVIRLLDTAGALDVTISTPDNEFMFQPCSNLFTENIYDIICSLFEYVTPFAISYSIVQIEGICSELDIDLWKHVELKLKYNSLRPYKHGKKY